MRALLGSAVAMLALLTACASDAESADPTPTTAEDVGTGLGPCEILGGTLRLVTESPNGADVDIFLEPDLSAESRAAVETAIADLGGVEQVDFHEDSTSYRLQLAAPFTFSRARFESIHGVLDVVVYGEAGAVDANAVFALLGTWLFGVDLAVFLEPWATAADVDTIVASIEPAAVDVRVVSEEETLEEFRLLYADQPEIIDTVSADILPRSVRAVLSEPIHGAQYRSMSFVREVVFPERGDAAAGLLTDRKLHSQLLALDDPLGEAAETLLDAHRRWADGGPDETLGSIFSVDELESVSESARTIATYAGEECGLRLVFPEE